MIVAVFICVCALLLTWGIWRAADFIGCHVGDQLAASIARPPACSHREAIPVDTLYGDRERVAWLCPDCDLQLPANYRREVRAYA